MTVEGWRADAACRGLSTRVWYARGEATQAVAVRICRACPVRTSCLAAALAEEGRVWGRAHGVRGGLTGRERDALRDAASPPSSPPRRLQALGASSGALDQLGR